MTRDEVKEVIYAIGNEYKDFIPEDDDRIAQKLETWYYSLKKYESRLVQIKVIELLHKHTFGTPSLANLMTLLNPEMTKQNIGQEFAERFMYLTRRLGADNMEAAIYQEYGYVGREIYLNNKHDARHLKDDDIGTFKAQIRNSFNSKYERKQKGHDVIENKVTLMIENQFFGKEVI